MNLKSTLLIGTLALSLFSCTKDEISTTQDVAVSEISEEFMAVSEQEQAVCGRGIKPVWFVIDHEDMGSHIKLRYFGYNHGEIETFYPDYANGKARYRAKPGVQPGDRVLTFSKNESKEHLWKRPGFLASYGGNDGARKYHYCIVDTTIDEGDQRIGKQYPTWGSCSGGVFTKNISWMLD